MKFRLITTVWGEEFADLFLRLTVRSLLTDGNVSALTRRHTAAYSIYTTEETAEYLKRSPLFQQLQRSITTQLLHFRSGDIDRAISSSHWVGWRKGTTVAKRNGEAAFYIIADVLYPENTLSRWADLFEQGYRAIWTSTVQVVQETALREIETRFPTTSTQPIALSYQDATNLVVRHLHPKTICMFRDSGRASRHPEVVFKPVPGEGLAQRVVGSHAFAVDPNFFDLSDALSPLNRFEAIAFENPTGVGLEPLMKDAELYVRRQSITDDRLSNMGSWLDYFLAPGNALETLRTYRFVFHPIADDSGFRSVSNSLGFFTNQVRLTGAIYRAVREMRRLGCTLAAQFTATAHFAGRLRRHWRIKGALTVFVPDNAAIERWGLGRFGTLMMPGNERGLIEAVFAHVTEGSLDYTIGDRLVAAGDSRFARVVHIIAGPYQRDDCTVYVVDRVLLPPVSSEKPRPALLPSNWENHPTRTFSNAEPESAATEVAAPAERAVERTPVTLPAESRTRAFAKAVYHRLRRIPGGERPADWLRTMVFRTWHRVRTFGERASVDRIAAVTGPNPTATTPAVPHDAVRQAPSSELTEWFRELQRARAVLTLAEVLHFYRDKVSTLTSDLPALAMVDDCMREAHITEDALVAALRDLLDRAPDFAEAWHELGDLMLANHAYPEAIDCFDRCLTSKEAFRTYGRTSSYVLAAAGKAAALEASGFLDAAAETWRRAMEAGGQSGPAHIAYARLLRRLGRPREAAPHFDVGLESDGTYSDFPSMPRNFAEVATRLTQRLAPITREKTEVAVS